MVSKERLKQQIEEKEGELKDLKAKLKRANTIIIDNTDSDVDSYRGSTLEIKIAKGTSIPDNIIVSFPPDHKGQTTEVYKKP